MPLGTMSLETRASQAGASAGDPVARRVQDGSFVLAKGSVQPSEDAAISVGQGNDGKSRRRMPTEYMMLERGSAEFLRIGDVAFWHFADFPHVRLRARYWEKRTSARELRRSDL